MADKSTPITIRSALPAELNKIDIFSNMKPKPGEPLKKVDLRSGVMRLQYYESILQDSIRVVVTYADSGSTIEMDGKLVSAVEGLPIVGQERVELWFTDNNKNEIKFGMEGKNSLYVNKVIPVQSDSTRSLVMLDLVSKEYIMNEKLRINTRFDGKISDHVKGILTSREFKKDGEEVQKDYLKTEKELFIEETTGDYIFCGNNWKPFYTMNWLSKKAVPGGGPDKDDKNSKLGPGQAFGNSAGYFLWETAKGFHFRSIDWLVNKEMNPKRKSILYNDSPDDAGKKMPEGYDIKALSMDKDNRLDVQKKLMMGAYSTRTIVFNPFSCVYEVITPDAYGSGKPDPKTGKPEPKGPTPPGDQTKMPHAGKGLPVMNEEFTLPEGAATENASGKGEISASREFSRTQYMIMDSGNLIADGSRDPKKWSEGTKEQLTKSQTYENFEIAKILNQSSMRYNQLFTTKISITIPGDFSLHAGDSIFFDGPQLTGDEKKDSMDEKDGGLYIIADICHYHTTKDTYTKMNLVRDSTGKEGTATEG